VWGATHPVEFGAEILDWDTWSTNPSRAFGRLIPDLLVMAATWGVGTAASGSSRAARAARLADQAAKPRPGALPDPLVWQPTRKLADGGLEAHDARGGHTLKKHSGKSDAYLRARIKKEGLKEASTFTNDDVANDAVAIAVARNERLISSDLATAPDGKLPLLPIDLQRPIGRIMAANGATTPSGKVLVVVVKDESPLGYHVLTAYPVK
jgi:hypothetical protein